MLVVIYNGTRHSEDNPFVCEFIYNNRVIRHIPSRALAEMSQTLFKEAFGYYNADDRQSRDFKFPKCCGRVEGCINAISEFALMDDGGVTIEKDKQLNS